jgi:hypothetical protein
MNPRVQAVEPGPNYTLIIEFANGQVRIFDVKPYLDKGIFRELEDPGYFGTVRPFLGSVQWPHGQDFCPDTLYMDSEPSPSGVSLQTALDGSRPKLEHQG